MTQYSNYSDTNIMTPVMYLKVDNIDTGHYIDYSGNNYHADVVTITDANDGLKLADNAILKEYIRSTGLYDIFYDSSDLPKEVLKAHIGRIYNNIFFNNDAYFMLCGEPLTGLSLTSTMNLFFGAIDANAQSIISATGVASELERRLIDTHIKDLKALNAIQSNLFKYNDINNSVIKALYGLVGTGFNNLKYNWIKATDEDTSLRLTLEEGTEERVIDNAINFDGTFALNTHLNGNTLNSTNSFGYGSIFNLGDGQATKNVVVADSVEMGCIGSAGSGLSLSIRRDDVSHSICEDTFQTPTKGTQYADTESKAFYLVNKDSNTDLRTYRDRLQIGTTTNPGASSYYNEEIILGNTSIDGVIDVNTMSVLPCGYAFIGNKIDSGALRGFIDAVIRLLSSKNHYYFPPNETSRV